jgi:hypothetical protein
MVEDKGGKNTKLKLYKFIATDEILYVKKHKWHQHDAD